MIPSTNILDIYRKKEGEGRGKVIAEKYFTFNSIMNTSRQIGIVKKNSLTPKSPITCPKIPNN